MIAEPALHGVTAHEGLDRSGEPEAEHERPQRLPEHEEALAQRSPDVHQDGGGGQHWGQERTKRPMAAETSLSFSVASSPPVRAASDTQWVR